MIETSLSMTQAVVASVAAETQFYGERSLETGGFFVAPVGSESVTGVALAGETGIVRHRRLFQITERALDRLFTYAATQDLWLPAQFHSHERMAFMSETDMQHGLRVEGFISTIIPEFAAPPLDVHAWGWWQFHAGEWRACMPPTLASGAVDFVVVFDEDGVHDA